MLDGSLWCADLPTDPKPSSDVLITHASSTILKQNGLSTALKSLLNELQEKKADLALAAVDYGKASEWSTYEKELNIVIQRARVTIVEAALIQQLKKKMDIALRIQRIKAQFDIMDGWDMVNSDLCLGLPEACHLAMRE